MNSEKSATSFNPLAAMTKIRGQIDDARPTSIVQPPQDVSVVAVSKRQPLSKVKDLLTAGHRIFGESRVQEALQKWPDLRSQFQGIELHMVGPLQTNKAAEAVAMFDVIHSLDRPSLASKLADEIAKSGRTIRCFVQVNTGEEAQKSGVSPADVSEFVQRCQQQWQLNIAGLMCIPPIDEEPALHFSLLSNIAKRNGLNALSMGMSDDYEIAVQFGATHVRIGTALFGPRQT